MSRKNRATLKIESSDHQGWDNTQIWQIINRRGDTESKFAQSLLSKWMPRIETLLSKVSTSPTDFTLHDADHSFRVAKRMSEIIPSTVLSKLSTYELTLLLLSAYLHDVGMSPEQKRVKQHYNFLLTGNKEGFSAEEVDEFQAWLDEDERGVTPPICKAVPTNGDLQLAMELTTHYCRFRHNDWSALWMRTQLKDEELGSYAHWLEDLVSLCKSHHENKFDLLKDTFTPKWVGSRSQIVHLRYLACVLRIADVLEFDPERTPDVVFRHRDISRESILYWYKDHAISLRKEGSRLSISARPSNAYIHKAIEITLDQIDYELQSCRWLADQTHFETCPGLTELLPHKWEMQQSVHRDIRPRDNSYEYVDGAFRPNTPKLLQMLSGIELYSNSFAAIRELLQNAFDAVREQIAYERLLRSDASNPQWEKKLGDLHQVELKLEQRGDGLWLICADDGVGMTKAIIANHLLVSGQARHRDVLALERKCKEKGFSVGRTGKFGIGVLSYFMIADRVIISTRRSNEARDDDSHGWRFETAGVGSFGELRHDNTRYRGSKVELHVREDVAKNMGDFLKSITKYLSDAIAFTPCKFSFLSSADARPVTSLMSGWTSEGSEMEEQLLSAFRGERREEDKPIHLFSRDKREAHEAEDLYWQQTEDEIREALRWVTKEGTFPDGFGRYRLQLPYFELPGGASLAFLRSRIESENLVCKAVGKGHCFVPGLRQRFSWKGMYCSVGKVVPIVERKYFKEGVFYHVDFEDDDAGVLSINRDILTLSEKALSAHNWLGKQIKEMLRSFVFAHRDSEYTRINSKLAKVSGPELDREKWIFPLPGKESVGKMIWRNIVFPATTSMLWRYIRTETVRWKGAKVDVLPCLQKTDDAAHYNGISWMSSNFPPDRITLLKGGYRRGLAPLWTSKPSLSTDSFKKVSFPPTWKKICGAKFSSYFGVHDSACFWNKNHPLVDKMNSELWKWACSQDESDPLKIQKQLLENKEKATAWILFFCSYGNIEVWKGLLERDPGFLTRIWELVFPSNEGFECAFWVEDSIDSCFRILSHNGARVLGRDPKDFDDYVPSVSGEWVLEIPEDRVPSYNSVNIRMLHRLSTNPRKAKRKQKKSVD